MSPKRYLVIGATSAIAVAFARRVAAERAILVLAGRREEACRAVADDLLARGASGAEIQHFDARDTDSHAALVDQAWQTLGEIDVVLVAHGSLPDQVEAARSAKEAASHIATNVTGSATVIGAIANNLEHQSHGSLVVISSVAGDRGRQSNYLYGASKAFLNTFLEGLRHRLQQASVHVMVVKPGFVDTPMTQNFEKGHLWATPDRVARDILKGIRRRRSVLYTPWYWRWIMLLICMLPERVMHATRL